MDARCDHPVAPADERRALLRHRHSNVLIVGHDAAVETVLSELYSLVRPPITSIRVDHRFDLPSLLTSGTLILRNLAALTLEDQRRLHDWMQRTGGVTQVVATSAVPLLPFLERGTFLDTLYYRLNVLYIEAETNPSWRRQVRPPH
jgi:transcriptional regulator of acetoin/glycerol metabolism